MILTLGGSLENSNDLKISPQDQLHFRGQRDLQAPFAVEDDDLLNLTTAEDQWSDWRPQKFSL